MERLAVYRWLTRFWLFRKVEQAVTIVLERHVSRSAAELAYFLMLSFFPLLICIHAAVGLAGLQRGDEMWNMTRGLLPPPAMDMLLDYTQYISENNSPALLAAGLFGLLTSSSAAFRSLMDIMDEIFGHKRFHGLTHMVVSALFSIALLATIYVSILLVITGRWFLEIVDALFGVGELLAGWLWLRFFILFVLLLLMISLFYRAVAPQGRKVSIWPGAIFSAVALLGVSLVFSLFIGFSSRYSLVYGSLASVIILMVWLYMCGQIVIIGNVVNYVLDHDPPPK